MKCPNCGYENRSGARFCHSCGEALAGQNPKDDKYATEPGTQPAPVSPSSDGTRPLAGASVAFAPLPGGALLRDGRYIVVEPRTTSAQTNMYVVEDSTPVRLCPDCRAETADARRTTCAVCGTDISHVEPLNLRYQMHESVDPQSYAVEGQLLEMGLAHPGLILPLDVFAETPYGPPRGYRVDAEFSPPAAAALGVPQELSRVLQWGISLAETLGYLHRHQVVMRAVDAKHIAVEGKRARWMHLEDAAVVSAAGASQREQRFSENVKGLAAVLLHLATGEERTVDADLPQRAADAFSQALAAPTGLTAADFVTALSEALREVRRPTSLTFAVGRRTDVGQERSLNEDSLMTIDMAAVFRSVCVPVGVFVVADGMGGHEAGDAASRLAVRAVARSAVRDFYSSAAAGDPLPDAREWLGGAILAANRAVYDQRRFAGTDMGTTLVMALVVGDHATIANVGDSRAYLLGEDGLVQLTTDHSLVQRLVATGQITPEEAEDHPQKNVIYRVIGDRPHTEPDLFEQDLATGEALLLCSDGLSGMISAKRMWQVWRDSASPQEACDRLAETANDAGGDDNITVVIVQLIE